ncbi:MAG: hypothetical protein ACR2JJ_12245 [Sphingomicrobium sp.]
MEIMLTAIVILGFVVVAVQLGLLRMSLVEIIKELRMLNIGGGEPKVPREEEAQVSIDSEAGR